jgi:hypothetical protein
MAIHSRQSRVDARITSGLLARSVLAYLGNANAGQESDALGNMFRLLEMYRHRAFSSPNYHGILERNPLDVAHHISASHSQSMGIVESALERAHAQAFQAQPRDEVVNILGRSSTTRFQTVGTWNVRRFF